MAELPRVEIFDQPAFHSDPYSLVLIFKIRIFYHKYKSKIRNIKRSSVGECDKMGPMFYCSTFLTWFLCKNRRIIFYTMLSVAPLCSSCSMLGQKEENGSQAMVDVTFRHGPAGRDLVAVLQKLYLCASVDFLMAVADFFLQALPQSPTAAKPAAQSNKLPLKQIAEPRGDAKPGRTWR